MFFKKGKVVKQLLFLPIFAAILALSGCVWVSPKKPFGEEKMPDSRAQAAISRLSAELAGEMPKNYYLSCGEGIYSQPAEFFGGEEKVAYLEADNGEYLLLGETLFFLDGEEVFCREMAWEQLFADEIAERAWQKAIALLNGGGAEIELEYIPMAEEHPYHLNAEFQSEDGETDFSLSAYFRTDGYCDIVIFKIDKNDRDSDFSEDIYLSASFYFGENEPLQKEWRIWHFAKECGLTEEPVPALSKRKSDREYCKSVMAKLDFASLAERAERDESLKFPFDEGKFDIE